MQPLPQPYTSSTRLKRSIGLAFTNMVAFIGYMILLVLIFAIIGYTSLLALLLLVVGMPMYVMSAFLGSYIYTVSRSQHFACKVGYFSALKIAASLNIQLWIYTILALIICFVLFFFSLTLALLGFVLVYVMFPLTGFYFILEWTLENKDNIYLSREPNLGYYGPAQPYNPAPVFNPRQGQYPTQPQYPVAPQYPAQPQIIKVEDPPVYCGECGMKLGNEARFCKNCGAAI